MKKKKLEEEGPSADVDDLLLSGSDIEDTDRKTTGLFS